MHTICSCKKKYLKLLLFAFSLIKHPKPSPSQIDPESLEALPDDIRHEIEQYYKRKDSHVTRGERINSHVTCGERSDLHVTNNHIQTQPPGNRVSERKTKTFEADDSHRKGKTQVVAAPKQVRFYSLFCNFKGV